MKKPDWTKLGTLQRCEQEYVWRYVRQLATTGPVSASAHFGQMVHVGVKALYDGKGTIEACDIVRGAWESSTANLIVANELRGRGYWSCPHCTVVNWDGKRSFHEHGDKFIMQPLPVLDMKKPHLRAYHAAAIVAEYAKAYIGKQPYTCVWNEGYGESATECALPDRAVRDAGGKLWAMDLKTTAMYISSTWQRSFEHSQQVAMQLDVLEAELGERLEGFILDAVNVKQPAISGTNLVRYGPLVYSDALRAELREHRQRLAKRADELAKLPEAALKAPSACVRYNDLCPYFDICQADPEDRETLVEIKRERAQLEVKEWVPSERD